MSILKPGSQPFDVEQCHEKLGVVVSWMLGAGIFTGACRAADNSGDPLFAVSWNEKNQGIKIHQSSVFASHLVCTTCRKDWIPKDGRELQGLCALAKLRKAHVLPQPNGVVGCTKDYLGNALTHDPKNAKTILAAGSIIQETPTDFSGQQFNG